MRIQPPIEARASAVHHRLTKICLGLALAATVIGTGACAQNKVTPEARLGAGGVGNDQNYRWNGNASRKGYGSKPLASLDGGAGQAGAGLGGAGSAANGGADTVLFLSDSTELTPESKSILDGYVAHLRGSSVRALSIEGHADERGTREYNIGLGARRAATVKSYLLSKGMLESQIKTMSYGKERPVATCDDISCWARNRRAQIIVAQR